MASSGKRKTTFAKLARESRLREKRIEKKAKKVARRLAAEESPQFMDPTGEGYDPTGEGYDPTGDELDRPGEELEPADEEPADTPAAEEAKKP